MERIDKWNDDLLKNYPLLQRHANYIRLSSFDIYFLEPQFHDHMTVMHQLFPIGMEPTHNLDIVSGLWYLCKWNEQRIRSAFLFNITIITINMIEAL